MRKVMMAVGAVAALLGVATSATARDTTPLEPSSKWVLDYADERCTLARSFGTGDDSITLRIDSYGSWNNFNTVLTGPLLPRTLTTFGSVRVAFPGDSERRDAIYAVKGQLGTATAYTFYLYVGPNNPADKGRKLFDDERRRRDHERGKPRPEYDRQVDSITFEFDRVSRLTLHVENMAAPLAALRSCVDDLYKSWGMNAEVQKSLSREARPLPQTILQLQNHFPVSKLSGPNAYVRVRIMVDATGQAKSCIMQGENVDPTFEKAVCSNLTGRFEPALDKDGHPVESMFSNAVIFLTD